MRIYQFALAFLCLFVPLAVIVSLEISAKNLDTESHMECEKNLKRAVDKATGILSGAEPGRMAEVKARTIEVFYETLAAGFGSIGNEAMKERIGSSVTLLIISDGTESIVYENQEERIERRDIGSILSDYGVIVPDNDCGFFSRGIQNVGVAALMKNGRYYPFGKGRWRYVCSVSNVVPHEEYYINLRGEGYASARYYHTEGCVFRGEESLAFKTEQECTQNGAEECPICGLCP